MKEGAAPTTGSDAPSAAESAAPGAAGPGAAESAMPAPGKTSAAWFKRAKARIPGGVSSPVRAFRAVGGEPIVIRSGDGARIEDVDGRSYIDFVCSWGPLILGHAHPAIVDTVHRAAARGTTYGAPCEVEIELAEAVTSLYPGLEKVRFVSSGTEATMSAIRLARGATGRDLIVKFSGCYHGHADHLLVAAGSGLATFGRPDSAGVPESFASQTCVLPLDDEEALETLFRREGDNIAAVIIEPIPANNGLLLQRPDFLTALRDVARRHGALLLFDEVISGFRVGPGGAAERFGITPDLATFGKVIGGGLPVGAFGGRAEIMDQLAPEGPVYQAGTLSGNPVAMAAGLETLRILEREQGWEKLEAAGEKLQTMLAPILEASTTPIQLVRCASIFWLAFQGGEAPRSAAAIDPLAAERYRRFFHLMLENGVYLAPSSYEVGFLSLAHEDRHLERFCDAIAAALAEMAPS